MPEAATADAPATIPLPAIQKPPAGSDTVGKTPMSAIFDRAREGQMPNPTVEVPAPGASTQPVAVPEKPTVETPVATTATPDFVPPEILTGDGKPPASEPAKEPTVADLMPEDPGPAIRTKEGQERYKIWRGHQLKLETENKDLKAKLKAQPSGDETAVARIQELEGRLMEMSGVVERADLLSHPAIQNQFIKPRTQAIESATQLLKDVEVDPKLLERALNTSGKARIEALDDLNEQVTSPTVRMKLLEYVSLIEQKDQELATAMSDVKGTNEQLQQHERANRHKAAQEQNKQFGLMADSVIEGLRDKIGLEFYKKADGKDDWNTSVDTRIAAVKRVVTDGTPEELCAAVALGATALDARNWALTEQKRRVAAEKELAELKGATPGLNGTGGGAGAPGPTEERTGIGAIVDRITKGGGVFGT